MTAAQAASSAPSLDALQHTDTIDPATQVTERKITVQYKAPDVSPVEIKQVEELYARGVPLIKITRQLQARRAHIRKPPLIYMDLYSILYIGVLERRVKQRAYPDYELTIADFVRFFKRWKLYGSLADCAKEIKDNEIEQVERFCINLFRSIGDRHRREKSQAHKGPAAVLAAAPPELETSLLKYAQRRFVPDSKYNDGSQKRDALVIFLDELPLEIIQQLLKFSTEAPVVAPGVQSTADIITAAAKQRANPANPRAVVSPDDSDLKKLDPRENLEAKAAELAALRRLEQQANRRLRQSKIDNPPSETVLASQSQGGGVEDEEDLEKLLAITANDADDRPDLPPGLSLNNLGDDD